MSNLDSIPRKLTPLIEAIQFPGDMGAMLYRVDDWPGHVLLDGGGPSYGPKSILAVGGQLVATFPGDSGDPFETLRAHLQRFESQTSEAWGFSGGVMGYFSYDAGRLIEVLPDQHPRQSALPDIHLMAFRVAIVRKERTGETVMIGMVDADDEADGLRVRAIMDELRLRLSAKGKTPEIPKAPFAPEQIVVPPREEHEVAIRKAQEHIRKGDIYQVNLARCFDAPRPLDLIAFYRRLRALNPAPFGVYLKVGDDALLSVSPERFLEVEGHKVSTKPIKGTAPRGKDPDADQRIAEGLLHSVKDRAELAMIVDVLRNDLSRVCVPQSVKVPQAMVLETHPTVHHLVATVVGELEPPCDRVDLLKATLPGGSITGAPRIRAMEIIDQLESVRRGPYCGSFGWLGYDGAMDLNILIRTAYTAQDRLLFMGGGGITVLSDPTAEVLETEDKVRAIMQALCDPAGEQHAN